MQKLSSFFSVTLFVFGFHTIYSEPVSYYYDDLSISARIYDDSNYVDRTLFYACNGVDKNYYFSRDIFSKECENISHLSTSLISYTPENNFLPSIRISTDVVSLIRFALSMIGFINFSNDTMDPVPISQYRFGNPVGDIQFEKELWMSFDECLK